MTGTDLREGFSRLVADEPPMHIDITPVTQKGKRLRTTRRVGYAAGSVGVVGLAAAAIAVPFVLAHDTTKPRLNVAPLAAFGGGASTDDLTAQQHRVVRAIETSSPTDWTFTTSADRWDGANLEGEVNDGAGPARLTVGVSPTNGSQQLHPCKDAEFRAVGQAARCRERTLADGSVLSLRDVIDSDGIKYIDVVLTHPDGGGVNAESGNFTIDWPPPSVATAQQKRDMVHASRPDPTYTVDQLGQVVLAVDRALNG
jgi:hypothetical protein